MQEIWLSTLVVNGILTLTAKQVILGDVPTVLQLKGQVTVNRGLALLVVIEYGTVVFQGKSTVCLSVQILFVDSMARLFVFHSMILAPTPSCGPAMPLGVHAPGTGVGVIVPRAGH